MKYDAVVHPNALVPKYNDYVQIIQCNHTYVEISISSAATKETLLQNVASSDGLLFHTDKDEICPDAGHVYRRVLSTESTENGLLLRTQKVQVQEFFHTLNMTAGSSHMSAGSVKKKSSGRRLEDTNKCPPPDWGWVIIDAWVEEECDENFTMDWKPESDVPFERTKIDIASQKWIAGSDIPDATSCHGYHCNENEEGQFCEQGKPGASSTNYICRNNNLVSIAFRPSTKQLATGMEEFGPWGGDDICSVSTKVKLIEDTTTFHIKLRYWALDSWDGGEEGTVKVNGKTIWSKSRRNSGDCQGGWNSGAPPKAHFNFGNSDIQFKTIVSSNSDLFVSFQKPCVKCKGKGSGSDWIGFYKTGEGTNYMGWYYATDSRVKGFVWSKSDVPPPGTYDLWFIPSGGKPGSYGSAKIVVEVASEQKFSDPWQDYGKQRCFIDLDLSADVTGLETVDLTITSNLNEARSNEAWGFSLTELSTTGKYSTSGSLCQDCYFHADFGWSVGIDLTWYTLHSAHAFAHANGKLNLGLKSGVTGTLMDVKESITVMNETNLIEIPIDIGPIKFTIVISLQVDLGIEIKLSVLPSTDDTSAVTAPSTSSVAIAAHAECSFKTGTEYKDGEWKPIQEHSYSKSITNPSRERLQLDIIPSVTITPRVFAKEFDYIKIGVPITVSKYFLCILWSMLCSHTKLTLPQFFSTPVMMSMMYY